MSFVLVPGSSAEVAVGAVSAQFTLTMIDGVQYQLTTTTAAWVAIGSNPTAQLRTTGSIYLPPNFPVLVICQGGANKVAIIQDTAGGFASLSQTQS